MQLLLARVFLLSLVIGVLTTPRFAALAHGCEAEAQTEASGIAQEISFDGAAHEEHSSDPAGDCQSHAHRLGCCQASVFLAREDWPTILAFSSSWIYLDFIATVKPGPFLEGLFRPPRV
jgi:hypothetical protein